MTELVEYRVDAANHGWERNDTLRKPLQRRIFIFIQGHVGQGVADNFFAVVQEFDNVGYRLQRAPQVPQLVLLQMSVFHTDASHALADIEEKVQLGLFNSLSETTELTDLIQPLVHLVSVRREGYLVHLLAAKT